MTEKHKHGAEPEALFVFWFDSSLPSWQPLKKKEA